MKALIVGFGRAGQRHAKILSQMGIEWQYIDPDVIGNNRLNVSDLTKVGGFDFAVVCTPPDHHLIACRQLVQAGFNKIVCEKPLCGLGELELDRARDLAKVAGDKITVTYNWRWHPDYVRAKAINWNGESRWMLYSDQYRPTIPEWGLLLDHLSHSVDTLRWLSGREPTVKFAKHIQYDNSAGKGERWEVRGGLGDGMHYVITDWVTSNKTAPRIAYIRGPMGYIVPDLSPEVLSQMFIDMWRDTLQWIEGDAAPPVGLPEAIKTQQVLKELEQKQ